MAAMRGAMRSLTIHDRIKAEELKREIRQLERAQDDIASKFAGYDVATVEEQLSVRLAFEENRKQLGLLSRELLRLVCI